MAKRPSQSTKVEVLAPDAHVNWYQIFNELVGGFDPAKLAADQEAALKSVGLERP